MEGQYPARTKELPWEKVENNYLLVDKDTKKSVTLDTVSFMVWTQCDGKTPVNEIVDVLSMGGNTDIVEATIKNILEKLETNGLIKWA